MKKPSKASKSSAPPHVDPSGHFDPGHGRLLKEWVALDGGQPSWVDLAREAHTFVKRGTA
jgi:hypothetical protein